MYHQHKFVSGLSNDLVVKIPAVLQEKTSQLLKITECLSETKNVDKAFFVSELEKALEIIEEIENINPKADYIIRLSESGKKWVTEYSNNVWSGMIIERNINLFDFSRNLARLKKIISSELIPKNNTYIDPAMFKITEQLSFCIFNSLSHINEILYFYPAKFNHKNINELSSIEIINPY